MNVYKDISEDYDLTDLNTAVKPVLSLYDEETKIQTLGPVTWNARNNYGYTYVHS